MPKTKEELKAELKANIRKIQKAVPDFKMTEAQIDEMLSDERMKIHEKAKTVKSGRGMSNDVMPKILKDIVPGGYLPENYQRNFYCVAKIDGSKESQAFNELIFESITRDDEIGEAKRMDYLLYVLNNSTGFDMSKLGRDVPEKVYYDYAFQNVDKAGSLMDTSFLVKNDDEYAIKPESQEHYILARRFGEVIGAPIRDSYVYAGDERFLTMPLKYLTDEQFEKYTTCNGQANTNEFTDVETHRRLMLRELNSYSANDLKPFTANDIVRKKNTRKVQGGYLPRREALVEGLEKVAALPDDIGIKGYAEVKAGLASLFDEINARGLDLDNDGIDAIVKKVEPLASLYSPIRTEVRKNHAGDERLAAIDTLIGDTIQKAHNFAKKNKLVALVHYYNKDKNIIRDDTYSAMQEALGQLNEFVEPMRTDTRFGEKQLLTQEDIFALRTRMATVLRLSREYLDAPQSDDRKYLAERISRQMESQISSLRSAVPGMTYDDAISGAQMSIDITGRKLDKVGNQLSTRLPMTITGPDGRVIKGFFTESTSLDQEKVMAEMKARLEEQYPGKGTVIDDLMAFHFKTPTRSEKENKTAKLRADYPAADEQTKILALYKAIEDMSDSFLITKERYVDTLEDESNTNVENRNIAMSDVADLLQVDGLLAKSIPLTVTRDGKEMTGCFMENAKGSDPRDIYGVTPFLDMTAESLDNTPALRQIADIQILDYICGNIDRHGGNLFYQFDENNKIIGVMGIDNDMSFSPKSGKTLNAMRFVKLSNLGVISNSMAEKVALMDPEDLKSALNARGISKEGVDGSLLRLSELKEVIRSGELRVMDDEAFAQHDFEYFKKLSDDNLYRNISLEMKNLRSLNTPDRVESIKNNPPAEKPKAEPLKAFAGIRASQVQQDLAAFEAHLNKVTIAQRKVHFGSPQYDEVENYLTTLTEYVANTAKKSVISTEEARMYLTSIRTLEKKCNVYLEKKAKDGPVKEGSKTEKRVNAVRRLKSFCIERATDLDNQLNPQKPELLEMKEESDRIQIEAFKENPRMAGDLMKSLNVMAAAQKDKPDVQRDIASQLNTITRFMKEAGVDADAMGVTREDLLAAKDNMDAGRKANLEIKKAGEGLVR